MRKGERSHVVRSVEGRLRVRAEVRRRLGQQTRQITQSGRAAMRPRHRHDHEHFGLARRYRVAESGFRASVTLDFEVARWSSNELRLVA